MEADDPNDVLTSTALGIRSPGPHEPGAPLSDQLAAGTTIKHLEIIRRLARGGMGDVYLARDTRLGRLVALKFLTVSTSPRRFIAEARATARITHENIVALYDIDEYRDVPFMVLEYVHGETFEALLQERNQASPAAALSAERAVELMIPVVRTLVRAHEAGIIHRDLKPSNIMLSRNGSVKVLDFGIAKMVDEASALSPLPDTPAGARRGPARETFAFTRNSDTYGSYPYMSPEQWGLGPVDHRTDLWAVGLILHEMTTGRHPLQGLSFERLRETVTDLSTPIPSVLGDRPDLGRLGTLIDRCLSKNLADRIESTSRLLFELESLARPERADDAGSPYPGLAAFQEGDARDFYGRERAVAEVVARLAEQPLVAIIGPSGAGKSSFVRAGIIPSLKRGGDRWESFIVRPGPHPLSALANLLTQEGVEVGSESDRQMVAERLRGEPGLLGAGLRGHARSRRERALLLVDQAEELYTLASAEERRAFLACLAGAADDAEAPLRVVLALRSDFLDRLTDAPVSLLELLSRGTILLRPLDRNGLRSSLVQPAEAAGYHFESPALVENMLDALEHTSGALPLLQFTAARLWDLRDREKRILTEASYQAIGGVAGALAGHADSVIAVLRSSERACARAILLRLVTPQRTRAILPMGELRELGGQAGADVDQVLGRLIDARLLTVDSSDNEFSRIEIVHESLIERWPVLDRWLQEEAQDVHFIARVRSAARDWESSGRVEGVLWRGESAKESERWLAAHQADRGAILGPREEQYLLDVVALARRSARRRRWFIAATIAALSVAVALVSSLAWRQSRAILAGRDSTRLAAARTQSDDPTTQLALLRELEGGSPPPGWAAETKQVLHAGVAVVVQRAHGDSVSSVAFSPDGKRIASASYDRTVRVWNADGSGRPMLLAGHTARLNGVAFSPDGRRIASASSDNTVRIWELDGSGRARVFERHGEIVLGVAFSPDGRRLVSASADHAVRVWNADGPGAPLVLRGHAHRVRAVRFSPDGRRIVSASWDKTVRIWNADGSGQPVVLTGHTGKVQDAAFSPDGRRIASVSDDGLRVWPVDGSGPSLLLGRLESGVFSYSLAFSPDGRRIACGVVDGTVRIWNLEGTAEPTILSGHAQPVVGVAFSPDGSRVASASWDRTVRVWSAADPKAPIVVRHPNILNDADFSQDGLRIASGSNEPLVRVWTGDGTGPPVVLSGHRDAVSHVKFSPDGRLLASASYDGSVRVWNSDGSGQPLVLAGHKAGYPLATFAPQRKRLALARENNTVEVWNLDGSGPPVVLAGHEGPVVNLAFSRDGRRLASAGLDQTVRIWNSDGTGKPMVFRADQKVRAIAFNPDGQSVAIGLARTVSLWTITGAGPLRPVGSHDHEVNAIAFSPDGRQVAAVAGRGVHLWNADGSGEPVVLKGHTGTVYSVAYSGDGRRIVTAAHDKTLRIWRDLEPISAQDPDLWRMTNDCLSPERRQQLLGITEAVGRRLHQRCVDRVAASGAGATAGLPR